MNKHTPSLTAAAPFLPGIISLNAKWRASLPAIVSDTETLSWADFDVHTNRLANALSEAGLKPGDAIALVMSNSPGMAIAITAAMKGGFVSAPLNTSLPAKALAGMIADANAKAVIASPEFTGALDDQDDRLPGLILVDGKASGAWQSLLDLQANAQSHPPAWQPERDAPLNIIYSSGTTGLPKGILHTHGTRLDWTYDLSLALRYHSGARTLLTLGMYSNISWVMMLCTWMCGGTLFLRKAFSPADVLGQVSANRITHTAMVPVQYQRILEDPSFSPDQLSSLQYIMSCGSPLLAETKSAWLEICPGVIELYGLTEGLITTLDPEDAAGRLASVGKPLPGTDIKILDDHDNECPANTPGEIVGLGRIAMPGYLNREDATRESTWVDPEGKAWLRTGDIGKLDEDGFLYIVDRKKDMIVSGGQNIYPHDLEMALLSHPSVLDAAVIGIPDERWGETPFAVVVRDTKTETPIEDILSEANSQLGKQQRIRHGALVDELPRNPNGKVLKRELRSRFG